jgi:hypothetical protein
VRSMQCTRKVHDGAYSGANQPVHGKRKTMCPCTLIPLYIVHVCKTPTAPEHAPTAIQPILKVLRTLGSRTPHPHPLLSHASLESGRGSLPFLHKIRCANQMTTQQRTFPAKAPLPGHRQATKTVSIVGRAVVGRQNEEQQ